jgi:hypothetical protein
LVFVVTTVDECAKLLTESSNELANLYEMSSNSKYSLTVAGEDRMMELQHIMAQKKKELNDLDLMFQYVKKLMDANAELNFLVGEEFASTQASDRIHSAIEHIKVQLDRVQLSELDLIAAKQLHIDKTPTATNEENTCEEDPVE